jgi:hypothetical protein
LLFHYADGFGAGELDGMLSYQSISSATGVI